MNLVITGEVDQIELLYGEDKFKKLIRQAILMERVGVPYLQ
jgi:hypothetical protein